MFNEGISKVGDILDIGTELEIVTKRGAFFSYNDTKLGQGRENVKEFLKQHPDMANAIEKEIRAHAAEANQLTRLGKSGTAVNYQRKAEGDFSHSLTSNESHRDAAR